MRARRGRVKSGLRRSRPDRSIFLALIVLILLSTPVPVVRSHTEQVQTTSDLEITYYSDPPDPVANSPATMFLQARNLTSGLQLPVLHFLVVMIPPTQSRPRLTPHVFSNTTTVTFDEPGNWILSFEIGLRNLASFDATAAFIADVTPGERSDQLSAFLNTIVAEVPKVYVKWGHVFAVVIWLGTMLVAVNSYRMSKRESDSFTGFAKVLRRADVVVALAIGLLVLTGVLRAFVHGLTSPFLLFESNYGLVLFAKISLAEGMIGMGIFNRVYLLPRLERLSASSPGKAGLARKMYYLVVVEIGLGVVAMLMGTIFTQVHTIS